MGQAAGQTIPMLVQVFPGMALIVLTGKLEFDGAGLEHGKASGRRYAHQTKEPGINSPSKGCEKLVKRA
jgi:hypothetical protein